MNSKYVNVDIGADLHKKLKVAAAKEGISMTQFINLKLLRFFDTPLKEDIGISHGTTEKIVGDIREITKNSPSDKALQELAKRKFTPVPKPGKKK